jgi:hypothetical protein
VQIFLASSALPCDDVSPQGQEGMILPTDKHNIDPHPQATQPVKKATLGQVAATMFWGMCMIGKKGTWERDGVKITLPQAIAGAVIAGLIVVFILVMLVRLAMR